MPEPPGVWEYTNADGKKRMLTFHDCAMSVRAAISLMLKALTFDDAVKRSEDIAWKMKNDIAKLESLEGKLNELQTYAMRKKKPTPSVPSIRH